MTARGVAHQRFMDRRDRSRSPVGRVTFAETEELREAYRKIRGAKRGGKVHKRRLKSICTRLLERLIQLVDLVLQEFSVGNRSHGDPSAEFYRSRKSQAIERLNEVRQGWLPRRDEYILIKTGNGAVFPIFWQAKKQGSVARSTTESEIIAMSAGMFSEVLNLQTLLEYLMQKPIELLFHQDNEAVLKILKNKYSAKLRHMNRVHKVNVASLCEVLEQEGVTAIYCPTADQRANGFTKIIPPYEWKTTTAQMCLVELAADV